MNRGEREQREWLAFHAWWESSGHAADSTFTSTMQNCAHAAWQACAASLAAEPGAAEGMVLVPVEPTEAWVHAFANMRQGQSDTPRCEPPTEWDIDYARRQIALVLRAAAYVRDRAAAPHQSGESGK